MRLDLYNNINTKDILEAINIKYEDIPRERGIARSGGERRTNIQLFGNPE